jgi:GrpB-like predicted nucleotidyltransferase (UPF0157 family)
MPTFAESLAAGGRQVGPVRDGEAVEIFDYDPAWPARFEQMRRRLAVALGAVALRIDHVGSTAVPGLAAKPIVDIQVSVPDVDDEASYRTSIEAQGFTLRFVEPGHRYFRPPPELPRLWQVHVCSTGSTWERDHLLFRDFLRAHPAEAERYAKLKRRLAAKHRHDRIAYTDAKAPFIDEVLVKAEGWPRAANWQP